MCIRVCPQELIYEFVYLLDIKKIIDLERTKAIKLTTVITSSHNQFNHIQLNRQNTCFMARVRYFYMEDI